MSVSCECFVLSGRGLCDELSLVQRSPIECGVSKECDREALKNKAAYAPKGLSSHWKKNTLSRS
jgi:hypothetical protein